MRLLLLPAAYALLQVWLMQRTLAGGAMRIDAAVEAWHFGYPLMLATFAAIAGITLPPDAGADSLNILPVLLGEAKTPVRTDNIHEQFGGKTSIAYRHGDWKLLLPEGRYQIYNRSISPGEITDLSLMELYNLADDPGESNNLSIKNPEKTMALFQMLKDSIERGGSRNGYQCPRPKIPHTLPDVSPVEKNKKTSNPKRMPPKPAIRAQRQSG
mgnify:CR=1 FL=1